MSSIIGDARRLATSMFMPQDTAPRAMLLRLADELIRAREFQTRANMVRAALAGVLIGKRQAKEADVLALLSVIEVECTAKTARGVRNFIVRTLKSRSRHGWVKVKRDGTLSIPDRLLKPKRGKR